MTPGVINELEPVGGLCHPARPGIPGPEIRGVRPGWRYGFANVDTFGIVIAWLIVTAMIVTSAALFWISQR